MNSAELQQVLDQAAALADSEVVTRALSRDVILPNTDKSAVLMRLSTPR
jgi:hypothetical protein